MNDVTTDEPLDLSADFAPFAGRVWLNCAHQAPLPHVARAEAEAAVAWEIARTDPRPPVTRLRSVFARDPFRRYPWLGPFDPSTPELVLLLQKSN